MKNRFTQKLSWMLLALFTLGLGAPAASASDIPLLTWERGKEQNIVMGNTDIPSTWTIKLVGDGYQPLTFRMSTRGTDGTIVYSVQIPSEMPIGTYSVQVLDTEGQLTTIVAGVDVIEMQTFEVVSIPSPLKFLLLSIVFLITGVTTLRSKKYANLSYVHHRSLIEEGTLMHDARFPPVLYKFYTLRAKSFDSLKSTLFRFLMSRDSEFLHRISPLSWTLLPGVAFVLGAFASIVTGEDMPNIPVAVLLLLVVIGLLDALSGFYVAASFITLQIVLGHVTNLSQLLAVVSISLSWILIGVIADLFYLTSMKDLNSKGSSENRIIALFLASAVAGGLFIFAQVLTNSFSVNLREDSQLINLLGVLVGLIFMGRTSFREKFDSRELNQVTTVNYVTTRIISGMFALIMWALFALTAYSWSQSLSTALVSASAFSIPLFALVVRFAQPEIKLLDKWRRNVYLEALLVLVITYGLFEFVARLPYPIVQRSQIYIVIAFIPAILHSLLSSLYDISESKRKEVVQ
jgi:hypothetical protein